MEQNNPHVSVIFKPSDGADTFFVNGTEKNNAIGSPALFSCEVVEAKIFADGETRVLLKGTVNNRIPFSGEIKRDSPSEKNFLRFLSAQVERENSSQNIVNQKVLSEIQAGLRQTASITNESSEIIESFLEVFDADFTWKRLRGRDSISKNHKSSTSVTKMKADQEDVGVINNDEPEKLVNSEKSVRRGEYPQTRLSVVRNITDDNPIPYQSISGFLAIEISGGNSEGNASDELVQAGQIPLADRVEFLSQTARFTVGSDGPRLEIELISRDQSGVLNYFFHIGSKTRNTNWTGYEGALCEVAESENRYLLTLSLRDFRPGKYEYTCYAQDSHTGESHWMGGYGNNLAFNIPRGLVDSSNIQISESGNLSARKVPLSSFDSFSRWCFKQRSLGNTGILLEPLFFNEVSRVKALQYYEEALRRLSKRRGLRTKAVVEMFRTLGLSNIVMVSPEGPHAIAGGLSQVIVGLSESLSREGLKITLITPLYEQAWGNHHISFQEASTKGIELFGERVIPELKGDINVGIPATRWEGGVGLAQPRRVIRIEVWETCVRGIRILFLRHKTIGDRLYGGISARDQMLRAVFLSRGALELCKDDKFNISPGILLSHDWLSSLVGPLLYLDDNYSVDDKLRLFTSIHMLHNVGPAYQGRFYLVEQGEYLWPIVGLSDSHVGGFLDEDSERVINFTKAACYHNKSALITVSRPYAEQLLENDSGEGLISTLKEKSSMLYGISNGIPQEAVRRAAFRRTDDVSTLFPRANKRKYLKREIKVSVDSVIRNKTCLKTLIQSENNLVVNSNAPLAVFVGRLTEQKGINLLIDRDKNGYCVLETALINYPNMQFLIAGPPSYSDPAFIQFKESFNDISLRYKGRCASLFEFVPHDYAIEITAASDLFLMPSRYEPGGITQLEALAVGTAVVAHRVGGLSATLSPFKEYSGTSFLFDEFTTSKFSASLQEALGVVVKEGKRKLLVERAISARNDWEHRVPYYLSLFQKVLGVFETLSSTVERFSGNRLELLQRIAASRQ
ncbi:MAG TPA: glycogen/starch synthase [Oligoflexia bacterium]|nr:glycogen/starch synthase [Oligoflexia bacterium]HMP47834.1 glycogen/starch synthase [Oligoflexia bacterium]